MRVLCIIESFGYGGAERLLISLLPELMSFDVYCDVVALGMPYSYDLAKELEAHGIKIYRLNISHRWLIPEIVYKLNRVCRNTKYDILWGHLYFGNLYAMLASIVNPKTKVVLTLHSPPGYADSPPVKIWHYLRLKIEKFGGLFLADKIIAVSQSVAYDYKQKLGWKNIGVVYNGIHVKSLPTALEPNARKQIRNVYGIPDDEFLLVVPARYAKQKGYPILLEALGLLAKEKGWLPMCIAAGGVGVYKPEIQKQIITLGLRNNVYLYDDLPQYDLFKLIQSADAVVIPSLREPFGIAAAESMALGVPTIMSSVDGLKELAGNEETAIMVPPGDPRSLVNAIWQLHVNPELGNKIRQAGKRRVYENFDISMSASGWAKVFSKLVEKTL